MARGKGDGSIFKDKHGIWRASLELPAVNGKRRRKKFTGKTRAEVRNKLEDAQRKLGQGEKVSTVRGISVEKAALDWLAVTRMSIENTTFSRYDTLIRNQIIPYLGKRAVKTITPTCVANFYCTLLDTKSEMTGKPLSNRTVQQAGTVLSLIFDSLELVNPCLKVKKPQPKRSEFEVWNPGEIAAFLKDAEADRYYPLYVLALGTGARLGEMLALKWDDFDEDAGTISITKSLEELNGKFRIKEPKNKTSFRTIALPRSVISCLCEHRGQAGEMMFSDTKGGFVRKPNLRRRSFRPLMENSGVPIIRFHDLRHTHATLLLCDKQPIHVVSHRLGHASVTITLEVYAHVMPGADAELAARWDVLNSNGPQNGSLRIAEVG